MSPRPFLFAVAAVAMALGATAATVSPAIASDTGLAVRYGDLDLRSESGRAALDARIERAARSVCGVANNTELKFARGVRECRDAAIAAAREQRDALVAGQERHASIRMVRITN